MLLFPASKNALLQEEMQFMAIGHRKDLLDHLTPALPKVHLLGKLLLAGMQVKDHPEQSPHSTSPALGRSPTEGAPEGNLGSNALLTSVTNTPRVGLAQELSRDPGGWWEQAE